MREANARCAMLVRCLTLLHEMKADRVGKTIDELAALAGVSTRTIRRDLEAIQAAGVALVDDDHRWRVFDRRQEAA